MKNAGVEQFTRLNWMWRNPETDMHKRVSTSSDLELGVETEARRFDGCHFNKAKTDLLFHPTDIIRHSDNWIHVNVDYIAAELLYGGVAYVSDYEDEYHGEFLGLAINLNDTMSYGSDAQTIKNDDDALHLYLWYLRGGHAGVTAWAVVKRQQAPIVPHIQNIYRSGLLTQEIEDIIMKDLRADDPSGESVRRIAKQYLDKKDFILDEPVRKMIESL